MTNQPGGGVEGQSGYGIVQAGFDSCLGSSYWLGYSCNGKSYVGWFEVYPAPTQFPVNFYANGGDSIYSDVYSHGATNPTYYWNYDVTIFDYTAGTGYSHNTTFGNFSKTDMGVPHYAQFMTENLGSPLPKFDEVTILGDVLVNGTFETIYNLYSSPYQYYNLYRLVNSGGTEIVNITAVQSDGTFEAVWKTSAGT